MEHSFSKVKIVPITQKKKKTAVKHHFNKVASVPEKSKMTSSTILKNKTQPVFFLKSGKSYFSSSKKKTPRKKSLDVKVYKPKINKKTKKKKKKRFVLKKL